MIRPIEMSWQANEEVSRDMTGEADGKNQGVDSRDGVMHIWMRDLWFSVMYCKIQIQFRLGCAQDPAVGSQTSWLDLWAAMWQGTLESKGLSEEEGKREGKVPNF